MSTYKNRTENSENEIRIRWVNPKVKEALSNIAEHMGVTMTDLLKPKLTEIANSYPEHMRRPLD